MAKKNLVCFGRKIITYCIKTEEEWKMKKKKRFGVCFGSKKNYFYKVIYSFIKEDGTVLELL